MIGDPFGMARVNRLSAIGGYRTPEEIKKYLASLQQQSNPYEAVLSRALGIGAPTTYDPTAPSETDIASGHDAYGRPILGSAAQSGDLDAAIQNLITTGGVSEGEDIRAQENVLNEANRAWQAAQRQIAGQTAARGVGLGQGSGQAQGILGGAYSSLMSNALTRLSALDAEREAGRRAGVSAALSKRAQDISKENSRLSLLASLARGGGGGGTTQIIQEKKEETPASAGTWGGGWGPWGYNNPTGLMASGGYYAGSPGWWAKRLAEKLK